MVTCLQRVLCLERVLKAGRSLTLLRRPCPSHLRQSGDAQFCLQTSLQHRAFQSTDAGAESSDVKHGSRVQLLNEYKKSREFFIVL